ncbi:MAG: hypothetical protein ABIP51_22210 [Bacteroidia bacterium]
MKKRILKHVCGAILATGFIFALSSCEKKQVTPSTTITSSQTGTPDQGLENAMTSFVLSGYNPVYGVSATNFYTVDPNTGSHTSLGAMIYDGSLPVLGATGVAKAVAPAFPNRFTICSTANSFCGSGSGTTFFFLTLPSTAVVRLGFLPGRYIKDIEYNPVDGFLYGWEGLTMVKITSLGAACSPGNTGALPVATPIGSPSSVGVGPYSLAFNYAGQCNVISSTDHMRAIVDHTNPGLPILGATLFSGGLPNMTNPQEVAFCISQNALLIGTIDKPTPTTLDYSFYHWATSGTIGQWLQQSDNCLNDYTSKPSNGIIRQ